jgi:hypothetical protein
LHLSLASPDVTSHSEKNEKQGRHKISVFVEIGRRKEFTEEVERSKEAVSKWYDRF